MNFYEKDYILNLIGDYLLNVDLYEGNMIQTLSYTLHHFEHYNKEYPIILLSAIKLIEYNKIKEVYKLSKRDQDDLDFWKKKCKISLMEHSLKEEKLKEVIQEVIEMHVSEILKQLK